MYSNYLCICYRYWERQHSDVCRA